MRNSSSVMNCKQKTKYTKMIISNTTKVHTYREYSDNKKQYRQTIWNTRYSKYYPKNICNLSENSVKKFRFPTLFLSHTATCINT